MKKKAAIFLTFCLILNIYGFVVYGEAKLINVAQYKPTICSGAEGNLPASQGNDGDTGTAFVSTGQRPTFWQVDLLQPYGIKKIELRQRGEFDWEKKGFSVYASNAPDFADKVLLGGLGETPFSGETWVLDVTETEQFRYVRVENPSSGIGFAEFRVFAFDDTAEPEDTNSYTNLSVKRHVTVSSNSAAAQNTVDGAYGTTWVSENEAAPFVIVDLNYSTKIDKVDIQFGKEGLVVQGSNSPDFTDAEQLGTTVRGKNERVYCFVETQSQFQYIKIESAGQICIGEIAILRQNPADSTLHLKNTALNKVVSQKIGDGEESVPTELSVLTDGSTGANFNFKWADLGFLKVDLNEAYAIQKIVVKQSDVSGQARKYNIYGCKNEDLSDMVILAAKDETNSDQRIFTQYIFQPKEFRYILIEKPQTSGSWDFCIDEIEVYAEKFHAKYTVPGNNEKILPDGEIMVYFSENVDVKSVSPQTVQLLKDNVPVAYTGTLSGKTYTIHPDAPLEKGAYYMVFINGEAVSSTDGTPNYTPFSSTIKVKNNIEVNLFAFNGEKLVLDVENTTETPQTVTLVNAAENNGVMEKAEILRLDVPFQGKVDALAESSNYAFLFTDLGTMHTAHKAVSSNGFAHEISPETYHAEEPIEFLNTDDVITIKGLTDKNQSEQTIMVLKPESTINAPEICYIGKAKIDANTGKYALQFTMPRNAERGEYLIYSANNGLDEPYMKPMYYITQKEKRDMAVQLSGYNADDLKAFFDNVENKKLLTAMGIYIAYYNELADKTTFVKKIDNLSLSGEPAELAKQINTILALETLSAAKPENVKSVIQEFNHLLGFDLEGDYRTITSRQLENHVGEFLSGKSYNNITEANEWFVYGVNITMLNYSENTTAALAFVENHNDFFELDLKGEFKKLDDVDQADVIRSIISLKELNKIQKDFASAVESFLPNRENGGDSGNRRSGGGGGSSGGGRRDANSFPAQPPVDLTPVEEPSKPEIEPHTYRDLSDAEWAAEAIQAISKRGIVGGDGTGLFSPNENITREQFVKIIVNAFSITESAKEIHFDDVDKDAWYFSYIQKAYSAGIVNGVTEDRFGIGEFISRQDMAVMIDRVMKTLKISLKGRETGTFLDEAAISDYAREAVQRMKRYEIMNGYDGKFDPLSPATRAQAAVMLNNLLVELEEGTNA